MSNAVSARERAGLSLKTAARKLRVSPRYLAEVERNGADSFALARRIARLYGIPVDAFLPSGRQMAATKKTGGPKRVRHATAAQSGKETGRCLTERKSASSTRGCSEW